MTTSQQPIRALWLLHLIEQKIKDSENMIAVMVRTSCKDGVPAVTIIATLKDMANDNIQAMTGLLGHSITYKIVTYDRG